MSKFANVTDELVTYVDTLVIRIGQTWLTQWATQSDLMIASVLDTMSEVKLAMDVDTKHSPSLRQTMAETVDVVAKGIGNIGKNLSKGVTGFSWNAALAGVGPQSGGMSYSGYDSIQPTASTSTMNDNRQMNMKIENHLDLQEVTRHMNKVFRRSTLHGAGV